MLAEYKLLTNNNNKCYSLVKLINKHTQGGPIKSELLTTPDAIIMHKNTPQFFTLLSTGGAPKPRALGHGLVDLCLSPALIFTHFTTVSARRQL